MAEFSLKPILTLFIIIIVGVVFLGEITDNQVENTELSRSINETITMTGQTGTTAFADVRSLTFFGNASGNDTDLANVAIGVEVNFTRSGTIIVDAEEFPADGPYNITYSYEGDLYVVDTKSHVFLKLLGLFFVFVIFAVGINTIRESSDDFNFGFGKVK